MATSKDNDLIETVVSMDIDVTSKDGKADLINKAFIQFKRELPKKVNGIIVYSKPLAVKILEEETKSYTERFLLIFLPRTKYEHKMKVRIESSILYLEN